MKKISIFIICLALILLSSTGFAEKKVNAAERITSGEYDKNGEVIVVVAKGLVCEFCAKALEKVLLKQDEVTGVGVNLTTKEIIINLNEGTTLDDDEIRKFIVDSGYNIESMSRSKGE